MVLVIVIAVVLLIVSLIIIYRYKIRHNTYRRSITINGEEFRFDVREVNVSDEYIDNIKNELEDVSSQNREWERQFSILMGHQGKGIELEKRRNIDGAISEYEQALEYGKKASLLSLNNYQHSAERLMILYRKRKEYEKEIALIKEILLFDLTDSDRREFEHRLNRSTLLYNKNNE